MGCKYCDTNDDNWDFKEIPMDFGMLGDYNLYVSITRRKKQIALELSSENGDLTLGNIDISYCPFCGEKL